MKISFIKLIIGCMVLAGSFLLAGNVMAECCSGAQLITDPPSIVVASCNDGSGVNYSVVNMYVWSCGAPLCTSYTVGQLWCPVGEYFIPIRWDIVGVGAYCTGGCMDCIRQSPAVYGSCSTCTPNCSCAASTCSGSTCPDGCGGTCAGTASNALLNVSKNGSGSGTVTSNPAGINCGATCSYSYTCNSSVTLSAVASGGSTFSGWGGYCSGTGACVVSMTQSRGVIATFGIPPPPAPTHLYHTGNTVNTISWAWDASLGATSYNVYLGGYYFASTTMRYFSFTSGLSFIQNQYYGAYNPLGDNYNLVPLLANYMHNFAVSACNVGGCSGLSISSAATSIEEPLRMEEGWGYKTSPTTMTSTKVCAFYVWNNGGTNIVQSLSGLTAGVSGVKFREVTTGRIRDYNQSDCWNMTGLSPLTSYSFYAKARNQQGDETAEYGPETRVTLGPTIIGSLRTYGPSGSILKLALIAISDALLINKGTVKNRIASGADLAAFLVETTNANASPVRIMTPMGIKAWRKAP